MSFPQVIEPTREMHHKKIDVWKHSSICPKRPLVIQAVKSHKDRLTISAEPTKEASWRPSEEEHAESIVGSYVSRIVALSSLYKMMDIDWSAKLASTEEQVQNLDKSTITLDLLWSALSTDIQSQAELWVTPVHKLSSTKARTRFTDVLRAFLIHRSESEAASDRSFTSRARSYLVNMADSEQVETTRLILDALEDAARNKDLTELPPIYASESESTSAVHLDWIFPHSRVGINVETDPSQSGWYLLVRQEGAPMLQEWGYLSTFNADWIVEQISSPKKA